MTIQQQQSIEYDLVTVVEITKECAICKTKYGAPIKVQWNASLPDPAPSIGEAWIVIRINRASWLFLSKGSSGDFNIMRYGIMLDARDCIGKARAVIDDVASMGIDEVYLKVASDNIVLWDSDCAADYGLQCDGDHVTELIEMLKYYGIAVTLVIGSDLWGYGYRTYVQFSVDGAARKKMCYNAACDAIAQLSSELYEKYGYYAKGLMFDGFGLSDDKCDFNEVNVKEFYSQYAEIPDVSYVDGSDFAKRDKWLAFLNETYGRFCEYAKTPSVDWPISVMVDGKVVSYVSGEKTGRLSSGLNDDFSKHGWQFLAMPMDFRRQTDKGLAMRSLEYCLAYLSRFAKYSTPIASVRVSDILSYDSMLGLVAKYDMPCCIIGNYNDWRLLSDADMAKVKDEMAKYRVARRFSGGSVGLVVSTMNRDSSSDNKSWTKCIEDISCSMMDVLPYRLKILFDDDLYDNTSFGDIKSLVFFDCRRLSDDALACIMSNMGKRINMVFVGRTATESGDYGIDSDYMLRVFHQRQKDIIDDSDGPILIKGGYIDINDRRYAFPSWMTVGYNRIVRGLPEDAIAYDEATKSFAPVLFDGASSYLPIDAFDAPAIADILSELIAYAMGE